MRDENARVGPVRAVGVDLMDTLVHDPWSEAVLRVTGMRPEASRALRDREAWADFELDRIGEDEYERRFFLPESGRRLDLAALKREFRASYRFLPGMEQLMLEVSRRLPVHILSNYPRWYEDVRDMFVLDRFVSGHHPSYVLGARKPAREYFERALARIGLPPHEVLSIDDREANVAAARALGMPAVLFTDAADLRRRLAALTPPLVGPPG